MRHIDKLLFAAFGLLPRLASATGYPARPISLIVPHAVSGGIDTAAGRSPDGLPYATAGIKPGD